MYIWSYMDVCGLKFTILIENCSTTTKAHYSSATLLQMFRAHTHANNQPKNYEPSDGCVHNNHIQEKEGATREGQYVLYLSNRWMAVPNSTHLWQVLSRAPYFLAMFLASAQSFPPAGWPTALASSIQDGSPNLSVLYASFSHRWRTSVKRLSAFPWSSSILESWAGFSLRASPMSFHLAVTGSNSLFTSNKSSQSAHYKRVNQIKHTQTHYTIH